MRLAWLGLAVFLAGCHKTDPCVSWCEEHFTKDKDCGTTFSGDTDNCSSDAAETDKLESFCSTDEARIAAESCDDWVFENDSGK